MTDSEHNPTPEVIQKQSAESAVPLWLKRAIQVMGLILLILGAPLTINLFCIFSFVAKGMRE